MIQVLLSFVFLFLSLLPGAAVSAESPQAQPPAPQEKVSVADVIPFTVANLRGH